MNKRIRLAVIACDETKAFHRIEELDRPRCLVARQLALGRFGGLFNGNDIAKHDQIAGRNLSAAIDQREFQLLSLGQAFKPGTLDRTDVNEYVLAALVALDEAEALTSIKELYGSLALSNDLRRHSAARTATTWSATAEAATRGTARCAAAKSTAVTKTATWGATSAEAISAARTITAAKAITAATEWIETVFAKTVPLVPAPAATTSIKTHKPEFTFVSSESASPEGADETHRAPE